MIKSFKSEVAEKLFKGISLTKKEQKKLGHINEEAAQEVLLILNRSNENDLMKMPSMHYHSLEGKRGHKKKDGVYYSLDLNGRRCKWRFTFQWENEEKVNVQLVNIEDTHK